MLLLNRTKLFEKVILFDIILLAIKLYIYIYLYYENFSK